MVAAAALGGGARGKLQCHGPWRTCDGCRSLVGVDMACTCAIVLVTFDIELAASSPWQLQAYRGPDVFWPAMHSVASARATLISSSIAIATSRNG